MTRRQVESPKWKFTIGDKEYIFDVMRDLTASRARQIKSWYGPELGRVQRFIVAMVEGDPDAWAAAIWCARKAAGEKNVPEPRNMEDFSIFDLMSQDQDEDEEDTGTEDDEAVRPVPTQTPSGKRTSKSSGTDTSDS